MSRPVKNLIVDSYRRRFDGHTGAVLVDLRGVGANANNAMRADLASKGIRVTVVKNRLARVALSGTPLEPATRLLEGACAFVYGGETAVEVARELRKYEKEIPNLEFKGAVLEGELFGPDEIEALSNYPTRDEAIANLAGLIQSPGRNLAGQITGPGSRVASLVEAIKDKKESGDLAA